MGKPRLKLVTPATEKRTVTPRRTPNRDPRRGGAAAVLKIEEATRKSTSGLPTYGTVFLLLLGVTISPGSPTLHVLFLAAKSEAMGQQRRF